MAVKPKSEAVSEITILEISQGSMEFAIVGTSPYYFNRMSEKAKRTLLLGGRKKTDADKAANLKHNPPEEYRDSVYRYADDNHATRLKVPCPAFKGVMTTAALVLPGTRKTEIGRLVWMPDRFLDFYGIPKLAMDVVRSSDIARTPDIRTRAILPRWACRVEVRFVTPNLNSKSIANLMAAGGIVAGVGDYRQEKGKGNFGQFRCCNLDDPEYLDIVKNEGRKAQDAALHHYEAYDAETEELLSWFSAEVVRLGRERDEPRKTATRAKAGRKAA